MSFRTSAAVAGSLEYIFEDVITRKLDKSGVAITKGVLLNQNKTNKNYEKCPTSGLRPFAVAVTDAAAGDVKVTAVQAPFHVYVTTSTTLDAGDLVKPSTTVSGQVERFVVGTDTDDKLVGEYIGRATNIVQDWGGKIATAQAAISAVVLVRLIA